MWGICSTERPVPACVFIGSHNVYALWLKRPLRKSKMRSGLFTITHIMRDPIIQKLKNNGQFFSGTFCGLKYVLLIFCSR
ncbi:hypothetical protein PB16LOC_02833 [Pectobacterium versatile]|nr:hypothetical protein PB16LOC_02833 [Pectobacterium versatile]